MQAQQQPLGKVRGAVGDAICGRCTVQYASMGFPHAPKKCGKEIPHEGWEGQEKIGPNAECTQETCVFLTPVQAVQSGPRHPASEAARPPSHRAGRRPPRPRPRGGRRRGRPRPRPGSDTRGARLSPAYVADGAVRGHCRFPCHRLGALQAAGRLGRAGSGGTLLLPSALYKRTSRWRKEAAP